MTHDFAQLRLTAPEVTHGLTNEGSRLAGEKQAVHLFVGDKPDYRERGYEQAALGAIPHDVLQPGPAELKRKVQEENVVNEGCYSDKSKRTGCDRPEL